MIKKNNTFRYYQMTIIACPDMADGMSDKILLWHQYYQSKVCNPYEFGQTFTYIICKIKEQSQFGTDSRLHHRVTQSTCQPGLQPKIWANSDTNHGLYSNYSISSWLWIGYYDCLQSNSKTGKFCDIFYSYFSSLLISWSIYSFWNRFFMVSILK